MAQQVGWLCSGTNDTHEWKGFLDRFKTGLGNNTRVVEKYAKGMYRRDDLAGLTDLAKGLINGTGSDKVDIIVATGGIVSLRAAVKAAGDLGKRIPILFIVGSDDNSIHDRNVSGGILLNVPSGNPQRVTELQKRYHATQVGLLVNYAAPMADKEIAEWNRAWGPVNAVGQNEQCPQINLQQAVADLVRAGATAIVVSGAACFMSRRRQLVPHLNGSQKPVCYPFDAYKDANPTRGQSMRFGPDLPSSYELLGQKSRAALSAITSQTPIPNVGIAEAVNTPDYWDNAAPSKQAD